MPRPHRPRRKKMKFRTRAGLLTAALAVQAVILAAGWFITFRVVQRSFARVIEQQVLDENKRLAQTVADLFPADIGSMVEFGSPEWERLQTIIEQDAFAELPAGGFACLVDGDGELLCHPEIRETPSLRNFSFRGVALREGLHPDAGAMPLLEAGTETDAAGGIFETGVGEFDYLATKPLAGSDLRLLVHQPVGELVSVGRQSTRFVTAAAAFAAVVTLGVTGAGLALLLRRYDSVQEDLNRQMRANLEIARDIQTSSLPAAWPTPEGYEIAAWSRPADETGGDTFDIVGVVPAGDSFRLTDRPPAGTIAMLLADATGHGIGPALAITQLQAMARIAWRTATCPASVASIVNERLADSLPEGRFITAWFGSLNAETGELTSFSAGHGPMLLVRGDGTAELSSAETYPLGIAPELSTSQPAGVRLAPGDLYVVVSDGIIEAMDQAREQYGAERLRALVATMKDQPAEAIADRIKDEISVYAGAPQDDQTVLVIRRNA